MPGRRRRVESMVKDDEIAGQAEFDRRIAALERQITEKIEKHGQRDLGVLTKAGMERKAILRVLALVVDEEGQKTWADEMRTRQNALKSIAGRMRTLARDAEERGRDPLSVVQTWFFLELGRVLGMEWPTPLADDPKFPCIISGMRVPAARWEEQASKFGRFLKLYAGKRTNNGVPLFLCLVCFWLHKQNPDHWHELANILTDAFEADGKRKRFSADWLRKVWKKRGKPMLRFWLKLNINTPPLATTRLSAISLPSRYIPGLID